MSENHPSDVFRGSNARFMESSNGKANYDVFLLVISISHSGMFNLSRANYIKFEKNNHEKTSSI